MKHLFTLLALIATMTARAQAPYNPDTDGDQYITTQDLMSMLAVFGGPFTPNYFDTEEICIVGVDYCFDTSEIPPITFQSYSDEIDAYDGWEYPDSHSFLYEFDAETAPIIPNGTQYWVLTNGSNNQTTIEHAILVYHEDGEVTEYQQVVHFHNNIEAATGSYGTSLNGLYPRFEKYMWWNGEIIKMN
ncbi:hypothetical protein N9L13_08240 [Flavobacteriales bacterium]|nr:hypothetical protein [Flavobacteriales bacterium]